MVSRVLSVLVAVCLLLPLAPTRAQPAAPAATPARQVALPAGVRKVASVEGINEYELANGLRVLLYPDQSKPTVTVNITFKVGSRMENYGETGMAHLLEHLIFKGSKHYPNPDVEFNRRGFRNNGTTSFDRTNYFSTFQASDDNLRWAIGWSADAMVNSFIAKKDLDSEMTVVRNEYEMGENQPSQVMFKRMFALMYDWHNYAKLPIGNRSDIENVRIENLQAFYRLYYQPDNAVLSIAGKFDEARTLGWIAESFGKIPRPKRTLPVFWTVEPTHDGERSFVVRRAGSVQLVVVAYRIPSALAVDTPALSAAVEVLGNTPNGRLHKELVEKGLAAQIFAFPMFLRDPGLVMFGAVVKPGEPLEPIRARIVDVVEGLAQQPPTDEELTRVKRDADTEYSRALADPQEFGISLSEYISLGDWRLFFVSRDQAQQVTSAQVAAAAGRYFLRDNRGVGMFIPEDKPQRAEIPAPLAVSEILKDFKPRAAVAAGEVFEPSQDNIDKRTRIIRMGDLKVALLPKQTRGQTVDVSMAFRYGDERSLQGKTLQRTLTDAMLVRGTTKLTRQQIADEFSRLKMQGGLRQFQTERAQLADALRLVAHVLREPSFPQAEVDLLKREVVTGLEAQRTDPSAAASDLLQSKVNTYPPGDPRSYISIADRLQQVPKITRDELVAFHKQFYGTARGEIAIVGDFDDKEIERVVRELFTGWASPAPYARILSEPRPTPPQRLIAATPDKENATYIGRVVVAMRDDDPDLPAMLLANYIFGGGSGLANRLTDRVRQRDGLSYGIGSNLNVNGFDRAGSFGIYAIAAPQNMAKVEAAVREELERSVRDGFTAKEVENARNGLLQQRVLARSEDPTLAAGWVYNLDLDRTYQFSKAIEARLRSLTVAEVNDAWRRHIDPAKFTIAIGGDPAKGIK